MEFTEEQQRTLDIDWYAVDSAGELAHFTSAGSKLPPSIAISEAENDLVCEYIGTLSSDSIAVVVSDQLEDIEHFSSEEERSRYLNYFTSIAGRGIYSFDKSNVGKYSDGNYHLVAIPTTPLKIDQVPLEIRSIIERTRIAGEISEITRLSIETIFG